jgi:hypothetical protein
LKDRNRISALVLGAGELGALMFYRFISHVPHLATPGIRVTWSSLKAPPERRSASDRRLLHDNEARAFKMLDKPLRDDLKKRSA